MADHTAKTTFHLKYTVYKTMAKGEKTSGNFIKPLETYDKIIVWYWKTRIFAPETIYDYFLPEFLPWNMNNANSTRNNMISLLDNITDKNVQSILHLNGTAKDVEYVQNSGFFP